jgi:hypothetical protein
MSYFNHAYKKTMLGQGTSWAPVSTKTSALTAGQLALVDACTYLALDPAAAVTANELMIVQGNYNQTDILGNNPLHGGYSESIKSKVIKPHYITRMWKSCCTSAKCPTISITIPDTCYPCSIDGALTPLAATTHPQIRIDIKGTEVLKALNRNAYFVADMTGCCPDGGYYTGASIATAWAEAINRDASDMGDFITAVPALNVLTITLCPSETIFDNCSFDTRDAYNYETLELGVSVLTEEGNACENTCLTYGTTTDGSTVGVPIGTAFPITTAWIMRTPAETLGESVLREIILDGRYRQDGGWNQGNKDSARFREIEGGALLSAEFPVVTTGGKGRRATYTYFYIQHTVPRFNNPTGVFDNDQYVVAIAIPCANEYLLAATETLWGRLALIATNADDCSLIECPQNSNDVTP